MRLTSVKTLAEGHAWVVGAYLTWVVVMDECPVAIHDASDEL